jgi:hypothetical protein
MFRADAGGDAGHDAEGESECHAGSEAESGAGGTEEAEAKRATRGGALSQAERDDAGEAGSGA